MPDNLSSHNPVPFSSHVPLSVCLISGGSAGTAVDLVLFPLDTIKTRLQSVQGFRASGGFSRIYAGIGPTLLVSAPNAAIFFFAYESLLRVMKYSTNQTQEYPMFASLLASIGAEFSACSIRVPGEVIKQRRQVAQYQQTFHSIINLYKTGGLLAFYQGFLPTISRDIPFVCIQFPIYEKLKIILSKKLNRALFPWESACCGSIAGGLSAMLTTPFDVLKTRTMLFSSTQPIPSMFQLLCSIVPKEGFGILWAGVVPRVAFITLGGAIYFGVYEKVKHSLSTIQ